MKKKYFLISFFLIGLILFTISKCKKEPEQVPVEPAKWQVLGVDVSQYQENIDWLALASQKNYKVKFAIIRSTMGDDRIDSKFEKNFSEAQVAGLIVGSYHYYDPNEPSTEQAWNYLKNSRQRENKIIPIIDIESLGKTQSVDNLFKGLKNCLDLVEKETGIKPMIYTGLDFFERYIEPRKEFEGYHLWLAAYSDKRADDEAVKRSCIRQFSEKIWLKGLKKRVRIDMNVIKNSDCWDHIQR